MSDTLVDAVAKAICEAAIAENNVAATMPTGAVSFSRNIGSEKFLWQAFTADAEAVLAAIEASGTHVVVPLHPTTAMSYAAPDFHESPSVAVEDIYEVMIAARPKPGEEAP